MGLLSRRISLLWIAVFLTIFLQRPCVGQEQGQEVKSGDSDNKQEKQICEEGECPNPDVEEAVDPGVEEEAVDPDPPPDVGGRLLTYEELRQNIGEKEGDKIYLSVLGKVYDVTKGREFYAPGAGYAVFAGHDGVVPFISGKFTEEEANKSTDVLTDLEMFQLKTSWVKFYREEERYPYLGKLIGTYYDEKGEPTDELKRIFKRWRDYKPPKRKPMKPRKKPKSVSKSKSSNKNA